MAAPSFTSAASPTWTVWQAAATDLVLPAKLPDGLIFAWRAGRERPEPHVIEIATYPESSAPPSRRSRDLLLAYLVRNEVPNVLVLVLRPKGQLRVSDRARRGSPDGVTEFGGRWRVVELWNVPAEPVLATADPGTDALGAADAIGQNRRRSCYGSAAR